MKKFVPAIASLVFAASIYFLFTMLKPTPPLEELQEARKSIVAAQSLNSKLYPNEMLINAQNLYDSAMRYWESENQHFIFRRKYDLVKSLATKSAAEAKKSMEVSYEMAEDLKRTTLRQVDDLTNLIISFQSIYKNVLLNTPPAYYSQAKFLHDEGLNAIRKNNYIQA